MEVCIENQMDADENHIYMTSICSDCSGKFVLERSVSPDELSLFRSGCPDLHSIKGAVHRNIPTSATKVTESLLGVVWGAGDVNLFTRVLPQNSLGLMSCPDGTAMRKDDPNPITWWLNAIPETCSLSSDFKGVIGSFLTN
ncbi:hypothetical protein CDAR_6721 [Caerostris darwini]|uniref:Uncharacterized protein n=1 Tax=Caerostris darwini TaxID=1538125 RepID=A0AAV4T7K8_9ARAC|nr:hypothetical protein CDAR_6721 [Caerostris darwini]